jgi:transcriptional regulator with XRE-family HTH domain
MTKKLSTYERKIKDPSFKKAFDDSYEELLFSELIISLMEEDNRSVRKLAIEANLSPSVIQDLRTGKQTDIKVKNLIKIANALGYELVLEKGEERLALHQCIRKGASNHISAVSSPHFSARN